MNTTPKLIESVYDVYHPEYNIQLKLTDYHTACYLSVKLKNKTFSIQPSHIREALNQYKITVGVNAEEIITLCQKLQQGQVVENELIAQGTLPQAGTPASLEFFIKPFSFEPEFEENDKGKINFKECNLFENVEAECKIARWQAAVLGQNGQAVTGEVIPAKLVANFTVKAGKGMEEREGHEFYSTEKGRVILNHNELSISDEYVISKDVDYNIGHIDFVGYVQVNGEVCDGFNITAKKGIRIYKNVGHCRLASDGDIEINGMNGRNEEATIHCGGNLTARYLNNVTVECKGDIHIWKDLYNCTVKCKGKIMVNGRVIGGTTIALAGLEAKEIGSDRGVNTTIMAGVDYEDLERLNDYYGKLVETTAQWKSWIIRSVPRGHACLYPWNLNLNRQEIEQLFKNFSLLRNMENDLQHKITCLRLARADLANPKINFDQQLSAGTKLDLGGSHVDIKESIPGPKSMLEVQGQEVIITDKTPLNKKSVSREHEPG